MNDRTNEFGRMNERTSFLKSERIFMTTITTFAVAQLADGTTRINDISVSATLHQGRGVFVRGIVGWPAREMLLRTINALTATGCYLGIRKIIVDFDFGNIDTSGVDMELFDFPVAVAIMNEIGFAKFDTSMVLRYVGRLCPDGRIELLGDVAYIACKERVFRDDELICANTLWRGARIDPGHVYLRTAYKLLNLVGKSDDGERG